MTAALVVFVIRILLVRIISHRVVHFASRLPATTKDKLAFRITGWCGAVRCGAVRCWPAVSRFHLLNPMNFVGTLEIHKCSYRQIDR